MSTTIDLESQAIAVVEQAHTITIIGQESYRLAWDYLKRLKAIQSTWQAHNEPVVTSAYHAWKQAVAARDKLLKPFQEAERFVKGLIAAYDQDQERLRLAQERKLQDDAVLAAAEEAQTNGHAQEAESILNGEVPVAPVILPAFTPKVAGGSIRENWKAKVLDVHALIKAVAEGKAPSSLLQVNQSALDQLAKATKKDFHVPGCQAYTEAIVSSSKRFA